MQRIDAHQHFWEYNPTEYAWIDNSMAVLRQNFLPDDLGPLLAESDIQGSLAVQARQSVEETQWLLQLAEENAFIRGVVGWAPIAEDSFPQFLEEASRTPKLKGLRHVVQAEPDGFLAGREFNAGIAALLPTGLVYEILITAHQLPEAIEFVDRHPNQIFVLDHLAKPQITQGLITPWAAKIIEIARRENVYCKLSGLVTEADWRRWTPSTLEPYVNVVLEAFTGSRLIFGSDWPVCTVASAYPQWSATVDELLAKLSVNERERILGLTAIGVYHLESD